MYESITYAELKSLPREQKVEALKELMATHSSQKKIAEKLGVNPPNIYSMVSRYIREDADTKSRKKKSRTRRASVTDEKMKEQDTGNRQDLGDAADEQFEAAVSGQVMEAVSDEQIGVEAAAPDNQAGRLDQSGFTVSVVKVLTGEEIRLMLTGVGNILSEDVKYKVDMRISEKQPETDC
jgi:predicted transcriptional regulator